MYICRWCLWVTSEVLFITGLNLSTWSTKCDDSSNASSALFGSVGSCDSSLRYVPLLICAVILMLHVMFGFFVALMHFQSTRDAENYDMFRAVSPKFEMELVIYKSIMIIGAMYLETKYPVYASAFIMICLYQSTVEIWRLVPYDLPWCNHLRMSLNSVLLTCSLGQFFASIFPENDYIGIALAASICITPVFSFLFFI